MRISDWSSDVCSSDLVELSDLHLLPFKLEPHAAADVHELVRQQPRARRSQPRHSCQVGLRRSAVVMAEGDHRHLRQGHLWSRPDHGYPWPDGLLPVDHLRRLIRSRSEEHTSELQSLMRISYAV